MKLLRNKLLLALLLFLIAVIPAMAINEPTSLSASTTRYSIAWTWAANTTWYNTSVYIDGAFVQNVTSPVSGTQSYTASGLSMGSNHSIGLRSTNMTGSYSGWVNGTAVTTATGLDVSNVTGTISDLGSILSSLVGLLQTVLVDNIEIFVIIVVLIILLYIIKRFGWSFSDFFENIISGLFKK